MIIRALQMFVVLIISVWLGVLLYRDPGYVVVAFNHWTIETTLGIALPGLILLFLIMHTLMQCFNWIVNIPQRWKNWRFKKRAQRAQMKTRQGLIEFSEGHWMQAKNDLINSLDATETPLINYLTAARAAQEMGDSQLRDDYLREAQQSMPEAKIAVELTQAQLQLANRQWEQALATLRHLQDLAPQHPYVLKLLMHLYEEVKDWPQLITLLPTLKRYQVISEPAFSTLQKNTYWQALSDLIKQNQIEATQHFIERLPKSLTNDSDIVAEYAHYLILNHNDHKAEAILRRCLKKQFNEKLISLYGQIKSESVRLDFVESLMKSHSNSAALLLCLGRVSKTNQLWGKAKNYLEQSIKQHPTQDAFSELGKLLEDLGDHNGAFNAYKQGLLLTTCL